MHSTLKISLFNTKRWLFSPRSLMGFLLGSTLYVRTAYKYAEMLEALGNRGNIVEAFVIQGSSPQLYTFSLLGLLFLLSNAPFVDGLTPYVILRSSKRTWMNAQIIYVVLTAFVYYLILFMVTVLATIRSCHFLGVWSKPFLLLSRNAPQYIILKYQLMFPFPEFSEIFNPIQAFVMTWTKNSLYGIFLGLCLITFNGWGRGLWGWAVVISIHILSYLAIMNGPEFVSPWISLVLYALPAYQTLGKPYPGLMSSIIMLLGLIGGLWVLCRKLVQTKDLRDL